MSGNLAMNIVGFKNDSVKEYIEVFIKDKAKKSENTAISYKQRIREFFTYQFNEDITQVSWSKIIELKKKDVLQYRDYLIDTKKLANSSVNVVIATLQSLWNFLESDNREINAKIWNIDNLDEVTNSYDSFRHDEVMLLLDYCKTHGRFKHKEKYLYFKTLYVTALRKTAALELKWDSIKQTRDNTGKMIWTIKTKDKGNKHDVIAIPDEFYEELLELKGSVTESKNNSVTESEYVFNINEKTVYQVLKDFVDELGLSETFKLSIHSVKSSSIDRAYELTGRDIKATSKHGHHSDINTTFKKYLGKNDDLISQPSYNFFSKVDVGLLECVSREDLIEAIKKCGDGVVRDIIGKL